MHTRLLVLVIAVMASPVAAQDGNRATVVEECRKDCGPGLSADPERESSRLGSVRGTTAWTPPQGSMIVPLKTTANAPLVAMQLPDSQDAERTPVSGALLSDAYGTARMAAKRMNEDLRLRQTVARPEEWVHAHQPAIDNALDARASRRMPFQPWCGGTPLRGRNR